MKQIEFEHFKGERSLFGVNSLELTDCVFSDGESPLKESYDLLIKGCLFQWKYPLWYSKNIKISRCSLFEMARAGIWYTNNVSVNDTLIQAPKAFRRCNGVALEDVYFSNAEETLWHCSNVSMKNVKAKGNYFALDSHDITIDNLYLDGNYSFDGVKNVTVRNSHLLSKDAFWNSENVVVYDSFISGEYLGWNSKNITFVNCTIESLQGMCYIDGITMKNCKLINTTLAFERSNVDAEIINTIDSVFEPEKGIINASSIKELIMKKDDGNVSVICDNVIKRSDKPEWEK